MMPMPNISRSFSSGMIIGAFGLWCLSGAIQTSEGRAWVVAQEHPLSDDSGPGDGERPFRTIAKAASVAMPGDIVQVRKGIYRERVAPARGGISGQPITYEAMDREEVIVTGADVWSPDWEVDSENSSILSSILQSEIPGYFDQFTEPYLSKEGRSLGQVTCDGKFIEEMSDFESMSERRGTWYLEREQRRLYINLPIGVTVREMPVIELTVRDRLFAPHKRGLGYITVRGFVFDRAANQFPLRFWVSDDYKYSHPQTGAVGTRSGHDWVIENNIIRYASSIGIDIGDEGGRDPEGTQKKPKDIGRHLIRNNRILDSGSTGIMGLGSYGTKIVGNVIEGTNRMGNTAFEWGGIKVHKFIDGEIRGNLLRNNDCAGIWLDNVYSGSLVTQNLLLGNEDMGIFIELGKGPVVVSHNIIGYTRGDGIYAHDASGILAAHNLLFGNSHFGFYAHVISERTVKDSDGERRPVQASNIKLLNNLFVDNFVGDISLPPESNRSSGNLSDYNLFLSGTREWWEKERFFGFRLNTNSGHASYALPSGIEVMDMTIESWREHTGRDLNSATGIITSKRPPSFMKGAGPDPAAKLSMGSLRFDMREPRFLDLVEAPRLEEAAVDYLGRRLEGEKVRPGPWSALESEKLPLALWPRPGGETNMEGR